VAALQHALKEWATAIAALEAGETITLLRKGGIREVGGRFQVPQRRVVLFPTYEHQQPEALKPEYGDRVGAKPGETLRIGSWADITDVLLLRDAAALSDLSPHHIWSDRVAETRFNWKPTQPLYVLLLRVYCLPQPVWIEPRSQYGGCRSWIELVEAIDLDGSDAAIAETDYARDVAAIQAAIPTACP